MFDLFARPVSTVSDHTTTNWKHYVQLSGDADHTMDSSGEMYQYRKWTLQQLRPKITKLT